MFLDFKPLLWILFFLIPISYSEYFVDNFVVIKWIEVYLWAILLTVTSLRGGRPLAQALPLEFKIIAFLLLSIRLVLLCFFRTFGVEWYSFFDALSFTWITYLCYRTLAIGPAAMGPTAKSSVENGSLARCSVERASEVESQGRAFTQLRSIMEWPLYLGASFVLVRALTHFSLARFGNSEFSTSAFASSFGNINMLTEYLVLILPFLILFSRAAHAQGARRWLVGLLFGLSLFFIYWGQSRSAWIGAVLVLGYAVFRKVAERRHLKIGLSVVAISLGLHFWWGEGALEGLRAEKNASNTARRSLVESSLGLIAEKPWGIGSELFEFFVAPYRVLTADPQNERILDRTPHNELLRWAIEHGWIYLLVVLTGLFLVMTRAYRHSDPVYFLFGLGLLPQILFQFPFQNAFPFALSALMLGCLMADSTKTNKAQKKGEAAGLVIAWVYLAVALPTLGFLTVSKYLEVHSLYHVDRSRLACQLYPVNWRSCIALVQGAFDRGEDSLARHYLESELERHPFNFWALKFAVLIDLKENRPDKACETAHLYESLLAYRGQYADFVKRNCQGPSRFRGLSGNALEQEYGRWFRERNALRH